MRARQSSSRPTTSSSLFMANHVSRLGSGAILAPRALQCGIIDHLARRCRRLCPFGRLRLELELELKVRLNESVNGANKPKREEKRREEKLPEADSTE